MGITKEDLASAVRLAEITRQLQRKSVMTDRDDHINAEGRALIMHDEGCVLHAYPDPATGGDPWTIGYGHTGPEVVRGLEITKDEAEALLAQDLDKFEQGVLHYLDDAPTGDNEFAAMVSLAYNIGLGNFAKSSVRKCHMAGDKAGAAATFSLWNKANGRVFDGLSRRRAEEAALYLKPDVVEPEEPSVVTPGPSRPWTVSSFLDRIFHRG